MPRAKQLTQSEKDQIDLLRRIHPEWTHAQIAEQLNRSRPAISSYLRNPQPQREVKRPGRPKVTSERDDRQILTMAVRDKKSCNEIRNELDLMISVSTIYRRLKKSTNIKFGVHQAKPILSAQHKIKRLSFAAEMISAPPDKWDKIIFSDVKKWNLDGPDGFRSFWYDLRQEKQMFSRRHSEGGGVMVWAGFASGGTAKICFCKPRMNSDDYQDILADYLLPVGPLITSGDYIFMQDNAPIHCSGSTKSWLEVNQVQTLPWPPLSPDLNPIENLWGWLTRRVYAHGRQFCSISDFKHTIVESWSEVTPELRKNLISSMKSRMMKVIQANGGSINY